MAEVNETQPVDVERAVVAAMSSLARFLGGARPEGVRVEEVIPPELSETNDWAVTLSHLEKGTPQPESLAVAALQLGALRPPPAPERVMHTILVDPYTAKAKAMRVFRAR